MFGLVERFIGAKMLEISREHWLGDQTALEALVRFTDEELKHQELFRRIDEMIARRHAARLPLPSPRQRRRAFVLGKSTWAVLALTCHIELFTQAHYRASIADADALSPLWKDVFLFHWREESQHAILDELEWAREDAKLRGAARDAAVDDLIALVGARRRHPAGAGQGRRRLLPASPAAAVSAARSRVRDTMLKAYRWQYIVSGVDGAALPEAARRPGQRGADARIQDALAPLTYAKPAQAEASSRPRTERNGNGPAEAGPFLRYRSLLAPRWRRREAQPTNARPAANSA